MRHQSSRPAFTLIELLVVLVIVSLVAGSVVLSSTGIWRQASTEATLNRLESLDQHMRSFARSRGKPCELVFDTYSKEVSKVYDIKERSNHGSTRLGRGFHLERVVMANRSSPRRKVAVHFDGDGSSPTYALEFEVAGKKAWLLFAGVSGQSMRLESEKDLDAAFSVTGP